jgi:hypothetical protein
MEDIINVLECFAPVFSARVWSHALILLIGAILCREERTVAAIPRIREGRPACHGLRE